MPWIVVPVLAILIYQLVFVSLNHLQTAKNKNKNDDNNNNKIINQ